MNIQQDSEPSNWRDEILNLERENCRAFVARDFEALERLWSDDLAVNSPINRVHDKKRILELLRAGKSVTPPWKATLS
jgi:hypothetical protein